MKVFSMFSGVGGFEQGIKKAMPDAEIVGFSEIDKYASMVLKYRYSEVKNYGDCKRIDYTRIPDFDLLVGGSPCQSFSIAGKRKGLSGASGLVWEYIRCLAEKKPRYFIWENVKGAMSSRRGLDYATILSVFSEQGYDLWWQILNAKDFGVPQNRERIFIVGVRGRSPREVFFERKSYKRITQAGGEKEFFKEYNASALKARDYKDGTTFIAIPVLTPDRPNKRQIRRLTPTECCRLMSWDSDWNKYGIDDKGNEVIMSDSQRYKQCGNGVVSNCIEWLIKNIILDDQSFNKEKPCIR